MMRSRRSVLVGVMAALLVVAAISWASNPARQGDDITTAVYGSSVGPGAQCVVELYLHDAIQISSFDIAISWISECSSPIPGATVTPDAIQSSIYHVTELPVGFSGPAMIFTCNIFYYDDECPARSLQSLTTQFGVVARDPDGEFIDTISVCPARFDCSYWPCTAQGPFVEKQCGDANGDELITATDSLVALQTAVGTGNCLPAHCDTNNDTQISAGDALRILQAGLSLGVELTCPFPCEAK